VKNIFFLLLITVLFTPACTYNVEEELYPDTGCDTDNITYSGTIVPILETTCFICHGAGINTGGITLEGYDNLKKVVDNGRLLGAIRREAGFTPMPQDQPQLPDCTIEKIEIWVDAGALNN